jgi:hypothetical protein
LLRQPPVPKEHPNSQDSAVLFAAAGIAEKRRREDLTKLADLKAADERETLSVRKKKNKSNAKKNKEGTSETAKKLTVDKRAKTNEHPVVDGPRKEMLVQDEASDDEDVDYEATEWRIVKHAVDQVDNKPKFMVHHGKRMDGREKYIWGEYEQLKGDGVVGLEHYIGENCTDTVYLDLLKPRKQKPAKPVKEAVVAVTKRRPCDHKDQVAYDEEQLATYCGVGCYLHGVTCGDGCGATFVDSKASEVKEGMRGVVPSGNSPVHCCINIGHPNDSIGYGAACGHAVCFDCWKIRILAQANSTGRGRRSSTRN